MSQTFGCEHLVDSDGRAKETRLIFGFTSKEVLNSNSLPNNTFLLSKAKRDLRQAAALSGAQWHFNPFLSQAFREYCELVAERNRSKSAARKKMNKDKLSSQEQEEVLRVIDRDFEAEISGRVEFLRSCGIPVSSDPTAGKRLGTGTQPLGNNGNGGLGTIPFSSPFMYDRCVVKIGVSPPTKRVCDPPNYYPTVKPVIDGLTDTLWWEDDNFHYINSTEFHYDKPNNTGHYLFDFYIVRNDG